MHVILVKIDGNRISKWQYLDSKWERELGELVKYDGVPMNVGIIGDTKDAVLDAINDVVKQQNKIERKQQKLDDRKFWRMVAVKRSELYQNLNS